MSNLPSELAEWRATQTNRRKDALVAFLAVRADVMEARQSGYAYKTTWEHLHEIGRFQYRYETFLRYAKRYITNVHGDQDATVKITDQKNGGDKSKPKQSVEPKKTISPLLNGELVKNGDE